ncbi:cell division protein FtsW [Phaeovibrio sulfidiphilus]|uniref:Probable peptidoglycan glycosyltransferase FtsW n=2 Tax=Phaeovibrio sulfidiphilus TaxID=1220600 RepID=A0A8J7CWI1_9PROT|nr:cell division protein FtsW [Phaeovibrio sulfidiphilus]
MFTRLDTSVVSNWRWTIDWVLVTAMMVLVVFGFILILAAGPSAARRINVDTMHFVNRQILFILAAIVLMMGTSLLSLKWLRRMGALGFLGVLGVLALVPVLGSEIKGSTRWISLGSFALQPSEFAKPLFAIVCAWLFAAGKEYRRFPGDLVALGLLGVLGGMLILQPDFGMTMIVSAVFGVQFFLAGLSLFWVFCLVAAGCAGAYLAYLLIPHVNHRVNAFLDPASTDQYQITQSMRAFTEGGFLGRGPGEGRIKSLLPDAHTDFIYSVAGEEFGLLLCLLIAGLFLFIALRATWRLRGERDLFAILATGGLIALISFQALINMASSLSLIPTKGMTLPFISYGGSSTLATALAMGMLLALSRHRPHGDSP